MKNSSSNNDNNNSTMNTEQKFFGGGAVVFVFRSKKGAIPPQEHPMTRNDQEEKWQKWVYVRHREYIKCSPSSKKWLPQQGRDRERTIFSAAADEDEWQTNGISTCTRWLLALENGKSGKRGYVNERKGN